jgi:spore maturation protein CgeB
MKIAYVTTKYNWESFSTLRCGYETLKNFGLNVDIFFDKHPSIFEYDQIWLMSSGIYLTDIEFAQTKGKVISFGLSEPCDIAIEKRKNCHIYCSNDYKISQKIGCYWFPTSADLRYHKNLKLNKHIDVLFIGIGNGHPNFPNRLKVVESIRDSGIRVEVYGDNWPKHIDNHSRINGIELIEKINQSNLMLDVTTSESSMARRIFEGLSCGTAILTLNRDDIKQLFVQDKEIFLYSCLDEIPSKIKEILEDKKNIERVSTNGQKRCIIEHDISHRIKKLLSYIEGV